jgi:hypothetical protein
MEASDPPRVTCQFEKSGATSDDPNNASALLIPGVADAACAAPPSAPIAPSPSDAQEKGVPPPIRLDEAGSAIFTYCA